MSFLICGLDEVGRGALAGPLMAVAALFRVEDSQAIQVGTRFPYFEMNFSPVVGVDDSKKLTAKKRQNAFKEILKAEPLVDFGIGEVSVEEINHYGIDRANSMAFERAVKDLSETPFFILVDGDNPIYNWSTLHQRVQPRADGLWWPVGAASILAKVIRDSFMAELAADYPLYGWEKNAGYGSELHRCSIIDFGPCEHHRTQFIRNFVRHV